MLINQPIVMNICSAWLNDNAFWSKHTVSSGFNAFNKGAWFYSLAKDIAFFVSAVHVGSALGEVALYGVSLLAPRFAVVSITAPFHPSTNNAIRFSKW